MRAGWLLLLPWLATLGACDGKLGEPCSPPTTDCQGVCVDENADARNCGACGSACGAGQVCVAAACAAQCPSGFDKCDVSGAPACVDTSHDDLNCGACGNACMSPQSCVDGACAVSCPTDALACEVNGQTACVVVAADHENCGQCGHVCPVDADCVSGACNCYGATACGDHCTDLFADPLDCGACGHVCDTGEQCVEGVCAVQVATGVEVFTANDDEVHWATESAIEKEPTSGGPPYLLTPTSGTSTVLSIQSTSDYVFWSDGSLDVVPGDGGTGSLLATGGVFRVAARDDSAYACIAGDDLATWHVSTPLQKTVIASGECTGDPVVRGDGLYWFDGSNLRHCVLPDCASLETIATLSSPPWIFAVDDGYVYTLAGSNPVTASRTAFGGATTVVATGLGYGELLAIDDSYVYVGDTQSVARAPKTGGSFTTIIPVATSAVAVTSSYVFYRPGYGSDLYRMTKP